MRLYSANAGKHSVKTIINFRPLMAIHTDERFVDVSASPLVFGVILDHPSI